MPNTQSNNSRQEERGKGRKQKNAPVLVDPESSNHNVRRVDSNHDSLSVSLLTVNSLNVDDPLLPVNLGHLSLAPLVRSTNDENLVVFSDGDRSGLDSSKQVRRG